jgi:NAD(P)-dependent dehydrogenase (short-subunit alcohol dehydrogenase family)
VPSSIALIVEGSRQTRQLQRESEVLDEWAGLAGKVAVITGGAGGLGRACTVALARVGMSVAVCDRDPDAVTEVAAILDDLGVASYQAVFDARDSDALTEFFTEVDERFGRIDVLVNIPGGGFRKRVIDMTPNGTSAVIRQNFLYALEACQHAARRMIDQGTGGSIVNMTTIEAHRAMPDMGVYGAMKAAVTHLTMTLAVELGPHGIRVNAIAPDLFPNASTAAAGFSEVDPDERLSQLEYEIAVPLGRKGEDLDVAGPVVFLASELSAYVTGTTIHIDGGTLATGGWVRWPEGYRNTIPHSVLARLPDASGD